jgi:hypothetical protein
VKCSGMHTTVVAFVGYVPKPVTPTTPLAKRKALGKRLCEPAYRRYAGGTLADRATSILTWTLFTPGQAQLKRGARWVRCDVLARSGDQLIPLPEGDSPARAGRARAAAHLPGRDRRGRLVLAPSRLPRRGGLPGRGRLPRRTCLHAGRSGALPGADETFGGFWQPPSGADGSRRPLHPVPLRDDCGDSPA